MTLMSIIHKTQELPSDQKLAVVLLAAGEGSRLGFTPKALLTKNGVSLLQRFCSVMADLKPIEFIVITGFHSEAIESELAMIRELINIPITVKHNIKGIFIEKPISNSIKNAKKIRFILKIMMNKLKMMNYFMQ